MLWAASIGLFGLVLAGGAFAATSEPVGMILTTLRGGEEGDFSPELRFSLAVMGAVTIGWAATLLLVAMHAIALEDRGRPLWHAMTTGVMSWFVIDCILSVATGFSLNVAPNLILVGMYAVGLFGSGALRRPA